MSGSACDCGRNSFEQNHEVRLILEEEAYAKGDFLARRVATDHDACPLPASPFGAIEIAENATSVRVILGGNNANSCVLFWKIERGKMD